MKEKRFAIENFPPEIQAKADQMNLDQNAVPPYTVPELPITENMTAGEFEKSVKPRLLDEFNRQMYGVIPPACEKVEYVVRREGIAFDGLAIRREISIICHHRGDSHVLPLLLYIPARREGKVPVLFGLNFRGNIAASADPEVEFIPFEKLPDPENIRHIAQRADESQRGTMAYRWEFEKVLKKGYAAATICYHDIFLDRPDGFHTSIMRFFYTSGEWYSPSRPSGAVSAWAWGIMRALDYLDTVPEINKDRIVVHGLSRLGKTALWAGANDSRVWLTVSNCSGTCGAKLAHRYFGEDYSWLNLWRDYWFCGKFAEYADRDAEFPVDQHFLMAAIAPRLLYIASATNDDYADPMGEYLSGKYASKAWNIYGKKGLEDTSFPAPASLISNDVGYYLREGEHEFMPENWDILLEFIEKHL